MAQPTLDNVNPTINPTACEVCDDSSFSTLHATRAGLSTGTTDGLTDDDGDGFFGDDIDCGGGEYLCDNGRCGDCSYRRDPCGGCWDFDCEECGGLYHYICECGAEKLADCDC